MTNCTIDQCHRTEMAKGLCSGHYQRKRIKGHPTADGPLRSNDKKRATFTECSVDGCDRTSRVASRSLCAKHYQRWQKHGDPTTLVRNSTGRSLNANGYVVLRTGTSRLALEHRVVMEEMLGRPLLPSENVHHMNGDRADNRPENLELWVKRQPQGQRVADRVADAVALLRQYAPELLRSDADDGRAA